MKERVGQLSSTINTCSWPAKLFYEWKVSDIVIPGVSMGSEERLILIPQLAAPPGTSHSDISVIVVLQDIGDATSVSLLNLDPSEHTPEVIFLLVMKSSSC